MKLNQALQLHSAIMAVINNGQPKSTKFNWALLRNKRMLDSLVEDDANHRKTSVDQAHAEAYEAERLKLIDLYVVKDQNGVPLVNGNRYVMHNTPAYNEAHDLLLKSNPDFATVVATTSKIDEESKNTDVELILNIVSVDDLPEVIEISLLDVLTPMIKD